MTTLRRLQTRVPTAQLGRWLLRSGIRLPAQLAATHVMRLPLDLDEMADLTAERIRGSATAAELEQLDPAAASLLEEVGDLLRDPAVVVWAALTERRGERGTTTVAGLTRGARALLLVDTPVDCVLVPLSASQIASEMASRVSLSQIARFAPVEVPTAALAAVSAAPSLRGPDADRALARAGVEPAALDPVWRVQADVHTFGLLGGGPAHDIDGGLHADVYVGRGGAVLKRESRPGVIRFEPADRSALTRVFAAAITAAT